jgi:voltage-gated potassium channel
MVKLSHAMHNSVGYQKTKSFFRSLFEDLSYPYKKYFDVFMIGLIMVSVSILVVNKTQNIPQWLVDIDLYFITAIFILEYLLRVWVSHDMHHYVVSETSAGRSVRFLAALRFKLHYMFSLPALIDLIAIFPDFRIVRLLKLYRYMHGASSLFDALLKKRFEFIFIGYMLFGITFTFGSLFYLLEFGVNKNLHSYLDAIYWALISIATVGYGDISPVTDLGKVVAMFGIVFGIAMISFVTSVMVSAFSQRFDELRNQDSINQVRKMHNVVLINGYGHLGATIAKKLKQQTFYTPVIMENDETRVRYAQEDGYQIIHTDTASMKMIEALHQKGNITAMLTLRSSDIDNIYFILNAKSVYAKSVVYSRMNNSELQLQYEATKVDGLVKPYDAVDTKAFHYLMKHGIEVNQSIHFFGYTQKSSHICQELHKVGVKISIYERDMTHITAAKNDGFVQVIHIDKQNDKMPEIRHGIVVCAMDDEAVNIYYSITLRAKGFGGEIVALSDTKEDNRKFILAGVNKIFDIYEESASQFVEMIENNAKKG